MTTVREARPEDEAVLRQIQVTALDEPWRELLETGIAGPPTVLVADDGGPVGYALVVPDHPVAYLAELAVAPPAQGQGYGTTLLSALFDRLRTASFDELRLTAREDDDRARGFYDQFDFDVVERIPDHYEDGDAVVLIREID